MSHRPVKLPDGIVLATRTTIRMTKFSDNKVHKYRDCRALKRKNAGEAVPLITNFLPENADACGYCLNRYRKEAQQAVATDGGETDA
jgi:hypothetical protein